MNEYTEAAVRRLVCALLVSKVTNNTGKEIEFAIKDLLNNLGISENSVQVEVEDGNSATIPQDRYDELLRSESEIDILCTIARDECIESRTLLAALDSIARMREQRLDSCEVEADDE